MYDFYRFSQERFEMMRAVRRELHMNPEVDRALPMTTATVAQQLDELGIIYKKFENNGIIAELGGNVTCKNVIALRADMDALEVLDEKQVAYKSKIPGFMHACGHDAHTAILLGTASILKSIENELNGRVRLIFQPAEETDGGAREMIAYGALDGVDAILGLHVDENLDTGTIGIHHGTVHAASNPFRITVKGKGSHGASPEAGVDSIFIAAKILDNLQAIVSREISATDSAVITIGKISGGSAANAICSSVSMEGIVRTLGRELRNNVKHRLEQIVKSTAEMYRGTAEICFVEGYPSFENNMQLAQWFGELPAAKHVNVKILTKPSMGVEDFAYYAEAVPAVFYRLGCRNEAAGIIHPAHGGYFDIDEQCLVHGAMLQSCAAFEYLAIR